MLEIAHPIFEHMPCKKITRLQWKITLGHPKNH